MLFRNLSVEMIKTPTMVERNMVDQLNVGIGILTASAVFPITLFSGLSAQAQTLDGLLCNDR